MACVQSPPVAASREAYHRMMRAYHSARLFCHLLQRALQRMVPGDGLGRVGSALQHEQMLGHLFFGLDLVADVQRHGKARRAAGMLHGLRKDLHRKHRNIFAAMLPVSFSPA